MTVSNVLNGRRSVNTQLRERVMEAIDRLDYRVNVAARNLRAGRTGTIGLAVPELDRPYAAQMASRIVRVASERGLRVVVEETGASRTGELDAIARSRVRLYDGLIIASVGLAARDLVDVLAPSPVVMLGERFTGSGVDHIGLPNRAGTAAAVEHLLGAGRTRIAIVGGPPEPDANSMARSPNFGYDLRIAGYERALQANNFPVDSRLIIVGDAWDTATGAACARAMCDDGLDFDAVVAMTDSIALGVIRGLADRNRDVPTDVAVVGFDNILESQYTVPSLTTIAPDHDELAAMAINLLMQRIAGDWPPVETTDHTVGFRLIVRESSGDSIVPT